MTGRNHAALIHRLATEVYNQANLALVDTLFTPIIRINDHVVSPTELKQAIGELHTTLPGFRVAIKIIGVVGDLVAAQWTIYRDGVGAAIRAMALPSLRLFRIADGKIIEVWLNRASVNRLYLLDSTSMFDLPGRCNGASSQSHLEA